MTSLQNDLLNADVAQVAAAYFSNNKIAISDIGKVLQEIRTGLAGPNADRPDPAVQIDKSITPDYIICLEDGKKLKMLKRYLKTHYQMTPDEYRSKWGLPAYYPMVAPNFSERRSERAKEQGLGRKIGRMNGASN